MGGRPRSSRSARLATICASRCIAVEGTATAADPHLVVPLNARKAAGVPRLLPEHSVSSVAFPPIAVRSCSSLQCQEGSGCTTVATGALRELRGLPPPLQFAVAVPFNARKAAVVRRLLPEHSVSSVASPPIAVAVAVRSCSSPLQYPETIRSCSSRRARTATARGTAENPEEISAPIARRSRCFPSLSMIRAR